MTYHPVVDRFAIPVALDPWSAAVFVALFAAVAIVTIRRPAYGLCALVIVTPFALSRDLAGTTITLQKAALLGLLTGLASHAGAFATFFLAFYSKCEDPPRPRFLT